MGRGGLHYRGSAGRGKVDRKKKKNDRETGNEPDRFTVALVAAVGVGWGRRAGGSGW